MNTIDLLVWTAIPDEKGKAEFWRHCNPERSPLEYTNDPEIAAFWRSEVGRFILWCNLTVDSITNKRRKQFLKYRRSKYGVH